MVWHESPTQAMPQTLREVGRMRAPGGLTAHLEQPQYPGMDLYEQFVRDWDAYNNNEPFWSVMHEYDLRQMMIDAGLSSSSSENDGDTDAPVDATRSPPITPVVPLSFVSDAATPPPVCARTFVLSPN